MAVVGTLIRVFDPHGQPVVGASVFPWLGTELWRERITNEQGEAWAEGLIGAGGLVVKLPGWRPGSKMMVFDGVLVEEFEVKAGEISELLRDM